MPPGVSISDLNGVVDDINNNYDNGTTDEGFLDDDPACSAGNNVPEAADDAFSTTTAAPVSGSLAGNDTASGDGGNVWTLTADASHGTVTVAASGDFVYAPNATYGGTDSFTYKVCDGDGDCARP